MDSSMIAMDPSNHITNDIYVTAGHTDATTLESTTSSFQSYVEYDVSKWMLLLYRPLCGVFGVTGNALCVIVLTTSSLRHSPTAVYLVTLSVLDFVISVYAGLDLLLKETGETQFFTQSWQCKLFYFTILFCAHWDTLTLVSMTSQRYVAVRFPLQAASWLTKKAALINIVVAGVIAFIANVVHLVTLEVQPSDGSYRARCEAVDGVGRKLENNVYPWVDFTLYFLFPSTSIVVLNLLIFKALRDARRFQSNANGATVSAVAKTSAAATPVIVEGSNSSNNKTSRCTGFDKTEPSKLIQEDKDNRYNVDNDFGESDNDDTFTGDGRPIARKNEEDELSIIRVILKTQHQTHTEDTDTEGKNRSGTRHSSDTLEMFPTGSRVSFDPSLGYVSYSHSLVEAEDGGGKSKAKSSAEFLSHRSDSAPALRDDSIQLPPASRPKSFSLMKRARSCCLCDCSTLSRSDSSQQFCEHCSSVFTVNSENTFPRGKKRRWSSISVGKQDCPFISLSDDDSPSRTIRHNCPVGGSHHASNKIGSTSATVTVLSTVSGSSPSLLAAVSSRSMSSAKPKQNPNSKTSLSPLSAPSTLSSRPATSSTMHVTSASRQLTLMLMTVSVAFLLLTLPLGVFVVVFRLIWNPTSGHEKASFGLFRGIAESLMYTNHAVNLILYWMAGKKFRTELKRLLCGRRRYCGLRARDRKSRTLWRISQAAHATSSAWA